MLSLGLVLTLPFALAQSSPVIDLGYARYQGTVDIATNITNFLGIRYAAAPLGDLRFRAPQPPVHVADVQPATVAPNECLQAASGKSPTNPLDSRAAQVSPSEDCLFLNDAAGRPLKDLPTVVWIHGGGYIAGQASSVSGEDIIKQSNHDVVVVLIQYRLGIFGFLASCAVKQDGALNAGLLDQDFALRWVNQHIAKFGGDPSKVTIWGESAGAGSVLQHVVANGGKTRPQLFRGLITSSTFLPSQYPFDDPIPEFLFRQVVAGANCTSAVNALTCLRAADANLLETLNNNINLGGFFGTYSTVPVIDGEFITQRPTLSFLERKVNGESLLSVTNTFEGTIFINPNVSVAAAPYALDLFPKLTPSQAKTVDALYGGLGTELFQVEAIYGESILICPTYYMLHAFPGMSFKGEFAIPSGLHISDVAYYFPGGVAPPFNNTDFINAFAHSFTSFIINQDPNHKVSETITPKWDRYVTGGYGYEETKMLFNKTDAGQPVVQPISTGEALLERCRFWSSVGNLTGQ
ncbi:Alpha/Beta hydrolase protein [Roridomyces roridus]|uniref:Carboxylic ester hydrolase n=1 Tax=Roridomyces roridus TaxID=1738132 RepID=A0AAD7FG71_9AGAR|nr:Alpha/Beta hydrolase protein [Roridomyces roridus]